MTGLDPDRDLIIEIFCLITDSALELLDPTGYGVVIHQTKETLDSLMDEWCVRTHGASGLTSAVLSSTTTAEEAADGLLAYIKKFVPEPRTALLAGNSVHADKAFLRKGAYKKVMDHLHYRILDVSTIKEAMRMWSPEEVKKGVPKKQGLHQAKEDILESIAEARYYKETIFQKSAS